MTGVRLQFALDDLTAISVLDGIEATGDDLFPLMDAIGRVLVNGARERIAVTNESPDGVAWPPSLRAETTGSRTLHDSGRLLTSITSEASARDVVVGSSLIYAGVHQEGAIIRAKTAKGLAFTLADGDEVVVGEVFVPMRPYLGISTAEAADIDDLTVMHFTGLLGGVQ